MTTTTKKEQSMSPTGTQIPGEEISLSGTGMTKFQSAKKGDESDKFPVYVQLANHLISEIRSGKYPIGSLIPTELKLCERYGVSRFTVREALRRLRDAGLVSRRQGAGTYVEALQVEAVYNQQLGSIADLFQYAKDARLEIRSVTRIKADAELAVLLDCRRSTEWIHLEGIRCVPGRKQVFCLTDVYVLPAFQGIEKELHKPQKSICELIEELYGQRITEIRQTISAVVTNAVESIALGMEPRAAALKTIRSYYDEKGRLLELSVSVHPADRFTYSMRLRRENSE